MKSKTSIKKQALTSGILDDGKPLVSNAPDNIRVSRHAFERVEYVMCDEITMKAIKYVTRPDVRHRPGEVDYLLDRLYVILHRKGDAAQARRELEVFFFSEKISGNKTARK